ncbi:DNA-directed RNA polymerase III subunit RPC9 isoform X4 [Numida meleagris]|uniref:DNA-directed RNA polymerase III subunit RPC9 isoform X4 n=1 Tax=Numida meleagris TaxID=8996 RepID=UPI000B3DC908|nr:DNA-directed RNA polymerase III subunit RPC9 isoform X4 [Numida meleagris]
MREKADEAEKPWMSQQDTMRKEECPSDVDCGERGAIPCAITQCLTVTFSAEDLAAALIGISQRASLEVSCPRKVGTWERTYMAARSTRVLMSCSRKDANAALLSNFEVFQLLTDLKQQRKESGKNKQSSGQQNLNTIMYEWEQAMKQRRKSDTGNAGLDLASAAREEFGNCRHQMCITRLLLSLEAPSSHLPR